MVTSSARGGLVGDQQRRLAGERHGDHRPLPHSAGKLVRVGGGALLWRVDADGFEQADGGALRLPPAFAAMNDHGFRDLAAHRHDRVERRHRLLEHHCDTVAAQLAPSRLALPDQLAVAKRDGPADPARRRHQAHQRERGHRFAAAALADDAERAAATDVEIDPGDDLAPCPATRKADAQVTDGDDV